MLASLVRGTRELLLLCPRTTVGSFLGANTMDDGRPVAVELPVASNERRFGLAMWHAAGAREQVTRRSSSPRRFTWSLTDQP